MVYSDPQNKQGVLERLRILVKADENTLPELEARGLLNNAIDDYSDLALKHAVGGRADSAAWDDLPVAEIDVVTDRIHYKMNDSMFSIYRVEIEDEQGTAFDLKPLLEEELQNISDSETASSGLPIYYYLRGQYVSLYPKPSYNRTDGLIVHYSRAYKHYDGIQEARSGIPSMHQNYLIYRAAYLYALKEDLTSQSRMEKLYLKEEDKIKSFYKRRNKQKRPKILPASTCSK